MKKYKYKESGRAVKFGDEITVTFEKFLEDKTVKVTHFITVDQFNVETLVNFGIIEEIKDVEDTLNFYVAKIANKLDCPHKAAKRFLLKAACLNKMNAFSMLLREVFEEFERQHVDSIRAYPNIYVISTLTNEIGSVKTTSDICYNNFAYFRLKDEAEKAKYIVEKLLEELLSYGKPE